MTIWNGIGILVSLKSWLATPAKAPILSKFFDISISILIKTLNQKFEILGLFELWNHRESPSNGKPT